MKHAFKAFLIVAFVTLSCAGVPHGIVRASDSESGDNPPSKKGTERVPTYSIEGTVTDEQGVPINGATILFGEYKCGSPVFPPTHSDSEGHFLIKDAPKEALWGWSGPTMLVTISAKEFAPELLELPAQEVTRDLKIKLRKAIPLGGSLWIFMAIHSGSLFSLRKTGVATLF